MICAWQEFLRIVPHTMREDVDKLGRQELQELRLRVGQSPRMVMKSNTELLDINTTAEDIRFVINNVSQYSPWAAATAAKGYLTGLGGHRVGICGDCVVQNGSVSGIRTPTSLCIRVARDFPGIAVSTLCRSGSVLILGPPGSGKTTFLRDLVRKWSGSGQGSIAVVDERGEIFPSVNGRYCFFPGSNTDILTGCSKHQGIDMLLRTMGPGCIAVDEITEDADCKALQAAGWCGVSLIATAHAHSAEDLQRRSVYQPLTKLFQTVITMDLQKGWKAERMCQYQ